MPTVDDETEPVWLLITVLIVVGSALVGMHVRGVTRRADRLEEFNKHSKVLEFRQGLLLDDFREAAKARVETEFKLRDVDRFLATMNSDIADARLQREPIDLRVYELNQKQHELLTADLQLHSRRLAEISSESEKISKEQERGSKEARAARDAGWIRAAFW